MSNGRFRAAVGLPVSAESALSPESLTGIRITELMSSNQHTLPDEHGSFPDWIEVSNTGVQAENLLGFGLSDLENRVRFVFPDLVLEPGQSVLVFASGWLQNEMPGAFHAPFKLSSAGEVLCLFNPQLDLIERIGFPSLGGDVSYAREGNRWARSQEPSPGFPNTTEGRLAFLYTYALENVSLQINEVMASNATGIVDQDLEFVDWIELHNSGNQVLDLSQFALSDDPTNPVKWRFPQGATIPAKGYFVVFASGKDLADPTAPHTNFRISAEHESLYLSDLLSHQVDSVTVDNLKTDMVYARLGDGAVWAVMDTPTPGEANP